jgi:HK97 family phage major capsid protein
MKIESLISRYERDGNAARDREKRAREQIEDILSAAGAEGRSSLVESEDQRCEELFSRIDAAKADAAKADENLKTLRSVKAEEDESDRAMRETHPTNAGRLYGAGGSYGESSPWTYLNDGRNAAVRSDQRFGDHEIVREYAARESERDKAVTGTFGGFAQQIRSLSTSGASAVVPTEWSFPIIDKARNNAVCFQAGATLVPMPAKVVQIGRLTTDPTATFRTEGSAVTASDPAFDFIQLSAVTLSALTVASMEFLQDAPNADQVVSDAIAKAMALELDKAILFGQLGATGTNDEGAAYALASPYPKGVLKNLLDNASGQVLGFGTNGTAQTAATPWNEVVASYYQVKTQNEVPGAIVSSDKLVQQYNSLYTSFNNVIDKPPVLRDVPWLTTNVIPSYTRGTMTSRATDLFVGDFSQVLVGQRLDFQVRVLTECYAELGQVGILSHWRGDVQVARPKALAVYRALQGA